MSSHQGSPNEMSTNAPTLRNDRQESILLAAERLFADRGFHAVTLRQKEDENAGSIAARNAGSTSAYCAWNCSPVMCASFAG